MWDNGQRQFLIRKATSHLYFRKIKLANEGNMDAAEFPKYDKCPAGGTQDDGRWADTQLVRTDRALLLIHAI